MSTTFYLVRHGVTSHTGHRLTGWMPNVHLTDEGRAQARNAAHRLAKVPLKAVYASPIARTMETAEPIAKAHRLRIRKREAIGEVRYGTWTNKSFGTLRRTKLWSVVQNYPSGARFPEGETLLEVQQRAIQEMERLRADHPKQAICLVSHADVIKLIAAHYLGMHIDLFQRIDISPASITIITVGDRGPMVHRVNTIPPPVEPS